MIQTVEAIIDPTGNVRLLETIHIRDVRRALVTILEEAPHLEKLESQSETPDESITATLSENDWATLSMNGLSAAYGDDEPDYPLQLIREWNLAKYLTHT